MISEPTKRCVKCNLDKPLPDFSNHIRKKDGKSSQCKACDREYRRTHPEAGRQSKINYAANHLEEKRQSGARLRAIPGHKERVAENARRRKQANPVHELFVLTRSRAKKSGIPFMIEEEELRLPDKCPVLGIKLEVAKSGRHRNSPSIEKLIPELGYVTGNVFIISDQANTIKSNGTADEHRRIAEWIESQIMHPPQRAEVSLFEAQPREKQTRARLLVATARKRCKKTGITFDLVGNEVIIPQICPILGIPIVFGPRKVHDNSPSLDKIVPELGYISSNVSVISWRANRIKNVGTAEEHRLIAEWIEKQLTREEELVLT